jgi:aspartokinase-like uncharacterized kinase
MTSIPGALERVCTAVGRTAADHRLVVVPGGGPFADAIRTFDRMHRLPDETAHWMAMLAMDQYAHVLAHRIPGAVLVDEPGEVLEVARPGQVTVLAPFRWMRAADVLPHTWDATSDSVAAFVAGALGASRLLLIKPVENGDVDPAFLSVLPLGLPYSILSWDRIEELSGRLSGPIAAGGPE